MERLLASLRPRLTYANVGVTICLFVLAGGGAYAAGKLAPNSVGTKQIKDGSVQSPDIGNGSVSNKDLSSKIDADTLQGKAAADFLSSSRGFVTASWDAGEGTARLGFDVADVPAGDTQLYAFAANHLVIHYSCPADPMATDGTAHIGIDGNGGYLFVDSGAANPAYFAVPANGFQTNVSTTRAGDMLTIQYETGATRSPGENLTTILFSSVARPGLAGVNNGFCHLQGQLMDGTQSLSG